MTDASRTLVTRTSKTRVAHFIMFILCSHPPPKHEQNHARQNQNRRDDVGEHLRLSDDGTAKEETEQTGEKER